MSFFSDLLKVGGTIGQFIPGGQALGQAAMGLGGILDSGEQQQRRDKLVAQGSKAGGAISALQQAALDRIFKEADAYDPAQESEVAITRAKDVAGEVLRQELGRTRVQYGGSDPYGDTGYAVSQAKDSHRVLDPLKEFVAKLKATEAQRKIEKYMPILGASPGSVASTYFDSAAGTAVGDPSGSAGLLASALDKIFKGGAMPNVGPNLGGNPDVSLPGSQSTSTPGYFQLSGGY